MKQLTCEMCGSIDLIKQDGVFVCQSCGCKYSVEDAKKMMIDGVVEVTGTVKVDGINDAEKLYENAKAFIKLREFEKCKKVLEELVNKYPDDYRGWWGMLELNTENFTKFYDFRYVFNRFENNFDFIKYFEHAIAVVSDENIKDTLQKTYNAWYEKRYDYLCKEFFPAAAIFANGCNGSVIYGLHGDEQFYKEGIANAQKCNKKIGVFKALGIDETHKALEINYCGEKKYEGFLSFIFVNGCTVYIAYTGGKSGFARLNTNIKYNNIDQYLASLPDGEPQKEFKGECYVATCVYGSYDCPQVWTLRRFRDNTLAEMMLGRAFIRTYYALSPTLVKWFGNTFWFKKMWKSTLDKMVSKLQDSGVEDTPYQDRIW